MPWGYTYENVISYDDLESLNGLQRQEAMLQAVALEEPGIQTAPSLHFDETRIPYEIECENCTWEEEILTVSAAGATMTLVFDMPADAEEYVRLSQFDLEVSDTEYITVSDGSIRRVSKVVPDEDAYYFGRNSYLFNLGYSDEERTSLTITFPIKGTFKLADIELYALPMANYPAQVEALRAEPLENIHWGTNSLTGTVDLSTDKVLCVSVPYSKGWTAAVDGEKTEILCGNYMFMCLPLTAGHHDIVFSYCSPGLKAGIIISLVSLGIVLYLYFADRKKQREKPEKKGGTGSEERSA